MRKRAVLVFLPFLFLFVLPFSLAEANTFITFIDAYSKEIVDDVFVSVDSGTDKTQYFIEEGKILRLSFEEGKEIFALFYVSHFDTAGLDYFGETKTSIDEHNIISVYLHPSASLQGVVVDENQNLVSNSQLHFSCSGNMPFEFPQESDQFGTFYLEAVKPGPCTIYARKHGKTGSVKVDLAQGDFEEVSLVLSQKESGFFRSFAFNIVLISIILIAILYVSRKSLKNRNNPVQKVKKSKLEDVLPTLRENEKRIVEFLRKEREASYLSKIHYKTGISKGALFRNLKSLERKKIIVRSKEGRVQRVKLSEDYR